MINLGPIAETFVGTRPSHNGWPTRLGQTGGQKDSRTGHEIHLEIEDDQKKKFLNILLVLEN